MKESELSERDKQDTTRMAALGNEVSPGESTAQLYIDPVKEAKLLVKLDLFLVPIIMLAYLACFLDRSNIGTDEPIPQRA